MSDLRQDFRPMRDLPIELNRVAVDLNALLVLAANESGHLVDVSTQNAGINLQTLAVLAMANLVSSMQLLSLMQKNAPENSSLVTFIESGPSRLIIAGKQQPGGLIFVALLGVHSPLGLARIEMQELSDMRWELPVQIMDDERTLIEQQLDANNLFDNLFDLDGRDEQ